VRVHRRITQRPRRPAAPIPYACSIPFRAAGVARSTAAVERGGGRPYLINRDGKVVESFPSHIEPLDPKLTGQTEALLTVK
jgi:hypothetical protein